MDSKKTLVAFAAVFVVVTLSLLAAVNDQRNEIAFGPSTPTVRSGLADSIMGGAWAQTEVTDKTLFTTGSATVSASPDKVTIQFSVQTQDDSAQVSQQENADKTAAVRAALIAKGIDASEIKTTGYTLYQVRDYNYQTGEYTDRGYRTTHSMKIELSDISEAGGMIDAAVSAGVNSVDGVYFGLSDDKLSDLRMQALEAAGKNARDKADSMASGLDVSVTRLMSATEGYTSSPVPMAAYDTVVRAESSGSAAPTEVTPGDITVTATVSAVFEIA